MFINFPSRKLTKFDNDVIITTSNEGIIEKFTKSLVCNLKDGSITSKNCECVSLTDKEMLLNMTNS